MLNQASSTKNQFLNNVEDVEMESFQTSPEEVSSNISMKHQQFLTLPNINQRN